MFDIILLSNCDNLIALLEWSKQETILIYSRKTCTNSLESSSKIKITLRTKLLLISFLLIFFKSLSSCRWKALLHRLTFYTSKCLHIVTYILYYILAYNVYLIIICLFIIILTKIMI